MRSSPVVAAILAVFAFLSPRFAFAQAAGLNVSPIQIYLTPNSRNTLLTIRNDGAEEGRYQLDVFDWGENERGEMQLRPTREVVFFPRLLVLKPGEQRNVRVGATAEPVNEEKTYRIFIEELPPPKRPGSGVGVKVLTKIGLPIFLTPNGAAAVPKLHDFKVA
ncbi:MAG TPA: fimbria/pilus periplasmic chaperone, partial [Myxococcaceae bacterium]|nr:fimbria/pilus periplasmic chaperone [Myxococcaceae bacterium]